MTDQADIGELSEVVGDQMARGIARDLAIKLLASLVSQMVGDQYGGIVHGHLRAIEGAETDVDAEVNEKIADHFRDLMIVEEGSAEQ